MSTIFNSRFTLLAIILPALIVGSCSKKEQDHRFELLSSEQTHIQFSNTVENTPEFNILNYLYFYDGGGVAVGDLNNNGLPDLFFTANDGPNRLYKNLGDFKFEDITEQAGILHQPGSWSTGVTMADVNGDGYLDIYVSHANYLNKSGRNQLFINNGDMTFTEQAADYGLDFEGYSTQAVFFDYNRDGRLDVFLLNHSFHSDKTYGVAEELRTIHDPKAGDRLFRNDGTTFTDVTKEAGIISSALGYGLGVAVSDINKDGWPDIYVGNDFHEDDYLYINNGDGTFTEMLYDYFSQTSRSSMGNDIADLNNDGNVEVLSLDMMSDDYETFMRSGGTDLYPIAKTKRDFGFGAKNARNTIHINRGLSPDGIPVFSEMAFSLGLAKTDWSWAALLADFDNSGFKDIFITNGIPRRPNDLDFTARLRVIRQQDDQEKVASDEYRAIGLMPENLDPNVVFKNHGNLKFEDVTSSWGFDVPVISNGAAWADLNGNGALDLVINNINVEASIYKNKTAPDSTARFLKVQLEGEGKNTSGIGSKVILYKNDQIFYQEQMLTRGFQSSVDPIMHFGLGMTEQIDSLLIIWPDWRFETRYDISVNQKITLRQEDSSGEYDFSKLHNTYDDAILVNETSESGLDFRHSENRYSDFNREPLMPYKLTTLGPALAVADVNGDGLDDVYIGGALRQGGKLFLQQQDGTFQSTQDALFEADAVAEDVDALFFDATGNGYLDLYVMSGGGQFTGMEEALKDRLYVNNGDGTFEKAEDALPEMYLNGAVVRAADFTGNGALDLFLGSRSIPWSYGRSPGSYLLENDGTGQFTNVTDKWYPDLIDIGMVTDAVWTDLNKDESLELVIVGEWMRPTILTVEDGKMRDVSREYGIQSGGGLFQHIRAEDLTGNGTPDLILGNFGTNSRIDASPEKPYVLVMNVFGDDGRESAVIGVERLGNIYPFDRLDELLLEFPFLKDRVRSYRDFSTKALPELLGRAEFAQAHKSDLRHMESGVYFNNGDGTLTWKSFPVEAQAFPVFASGVIDGSDGAKHVLLAGNLHEVKPGIGGLQGSGSGLHLRINSDQNMKVLNLNESGFHVRGEARAIHNIRSADGSHSWIVALNNHQPQIFRKNVRN